MRSHILSRFKQHASTRTIEAIDEQSEHVDFRFSGGVTLRTTKPEAKEITKMIKAKEKKEKEKGEQSE